MQISTDNGKTYQTFISAELVSVRIDNPLSLQTLFETTYDHILSKSLSTNMYSSETHSAEEIAQVDRIYEDTLPEYSFINNGIQFAIRNPEAAKCDFLNPNTGWKVHLNVKPENVTAVSEYLKKEGYAHKYLYGGVGSEGKAFTLYIGSFALTHKLAREISSTLGELLAQPTAHDEVELAQGIAGRFTAITPSSSEEAPVFTQYGVYGMSARKEKLLSMGNWTKIVTQESKKELATDAYNALTEKYGTYFTG